MTALRDLREVLTHLWHVWPALLVERIDLLTDELNQWTREHR